MFHSRFAHRKTLENTLVLMMAIGGMLVMLMLMYGVARLRHHMLYAFCCAFLATVMHIVEADALKQKEKHQTPRQAISHYLPYHLICCIILFAVYYRVLLTDSPLPVSPLQSFTR